MKQSSKMDGRMSQTLKELKDKILDNHWENTTFILNTDDSLGAIGVVVSQIREIG